MINATKVPPKPRKSLGQAGEGRAGGTTPGGRASPGPWPRTLRPPGLSQPLRGSGSGDTAGPPFPRPIPQGSHPLGRSWEAGRRQRLRSALPRAEQSEPGRKQQGKRRLPLGRAGLFLHRQRRPELPAPGPRAGTHPPPGDHWPGAHSTTRQPSALTAGPCCHLAPQEGRRPGRVPAGPHPRASRPVAPAGEGEEAPRGQGTHEPGAGWASAERHRWGGVPRGHGTWHPETSRWALGGCRRGWKTGSPAFGGVALCPCAPVVPWRAASLVPPAPPEAKGERPRPPGPTGLTGRDGGCPRRPRATGRKQGSGRPRGPPGPGAERQRVGSQRRPAQARLSGSSRNRTEAGTVPRGSWRGCQPGATVGRLRRAARRVP